MRPGWGFWVAIVFLWASPIYAADRSVEPIVSRIPREPVDSTGLSAVGYSKRLRALEIEFHDGSIYRYLEVPHSIYREMIATDSKARYYNQYVKGKFHCLRVKARRKS